MVIVIDQSERGRDKRGRRGVEANSSRNHLRWEKTSFLYVESEVVQIKL